MSFKPPKFVTSADLQRSLDITKQMDRLNSVDRLRILNNPRFSNLSGFDAMIDLKKEVDFITSGPFYNPKPPKIK